MEPATNSTPPDTRPIALVTFDLYDTLIELTPPRWERLAAVCRRLGLAADPAALLASDRVAEDYYTEENTIRPIRDRTAAEREAFRLTLMGRWLRSAGLPDDPETTQAARRAYLAEFEADADGGNYRVFPDVMPALERLRAAGVKRAVISNADADVTALCTRLAFAHGMDAIITSALVGYEKPDPRTFRAALDHPAIATHPADALHIGDQPRSDVVGAVGVGMRAALIDRYDRHADGAHPAWRVGSLLDLVDRVLAHNAACLTRA
ncbi:MAG: HAD-IA family hydrolase [Chloroflexota bacterium]|nr:HAD-IA family hydrolase [Chloroflexota bacterium]